MQKLRLVVTALLFFSTSPTAPAQADESVTLTTVAMRVHKMAEMVAFYEEAFGMGFREVDTSGLRSRFGRVGGITLKLVPLRDSVDFEGYGSHQLGFEVADVEAVIAIAIRHGGRQEGELRRDGDRLHGSVRDPDGNTLELYGPAKTQD
ncbi:MAG: VOC family protein [Acidobacteriota bacterium]